MCPLTQHGQDRVGVVGRDDRAHAGADVEHERPRLVPPAGVEVGPEARFAVPQIRPFHDRAVTGTRSTARIASYGIRFAPAGKKYQRTTRVSGSQVMNRSS